tara:strand:+ start:472 stop:1683 length:1212 start_codon:yes stop_codon:yes gene_type:complete
MAKILKLENELSGDKKPIKVEDESTGLLLDNENVYVENDLETKTLKTIEGATIGGDLTIDGGVTSDDLTISGDLTVTGGNISSPTDGSLTIKADTDLIFQIDSDNDGTETFQFKNGGGTEIASLDESGDLQIDGDLTISGGKITFGNSEIVHNETDNVITLSSPSVFVNAKGLGENANLIIWGEDENDASIQFWEGVSVRFAVGCDYSDSYTLKWDYGVTSVGGGTKMSLTTAGQLTVADDVIDDGNDPTVDAQLTNKQYVDGLAVVKRAEVTLSESDMNSLHSTEITLVAAQGANKVIIPTSGMLFVDRDSSTAQAGGAADLIVGWGGADSYTTDTIYYIRRFMYNEGGDRIFHLQHYTGECGQSLTAGDNQPLTIKLDSAITSGSIDSMKVVITYHVYDNS